jgi:cytochrome P450
MSSLERFDLMDPATQADPYPWYDVLRHEAPLYRMPSTGFWLVTSFDLCREVIRQPDLFLSGVSPMALRPGGVPPEIIELYRTQGWLPNSSCSTSDPPLHTRVRRALERLFTAGRVRELAPAIDAIVAELLDEIGTARELEFVRRFAHPLPMMVIADLLGVPRGDLARFKAWSDAIVEPFSMMVSRERELECARLVVEMQHYFADIVAVRRERPGDDLVSAVVHADLEGLEPFDLREILTIITIDLLASGNETTTAAIASGLLLLARDPAPLAEIRADAELVYPFVEEVLRLESPAQGMFRRVAADTRLGGIDLRAGELLSLRFGAANRDASQFPQPARIDLHRQQPGKHLAFGQGRHHCIGAALARQEMLSAFNGLFARYESFAPAPGAPAPAYVPSFFGRALRELQLVLTPRAPAPA